VPNSGPRTWVAKRNREQQAFSFGPWKSDAQNGPKTENAWDSSTADDATHDNGERKAKTHATKLQQKKNDIFKFEGE